MQKETWTFTSGHLTGPARLARWGHYGSPLLLFPSAGGDCEEMERFGMVHALSWLIDAGRIKLYSVDAPAVADWLRATLPPEECARRQIQYDAFIHEDVVPRVRRDCQNDRLELVTAGVSLGAFQAVAALTLHPEVHRVAIGLSGVYDMSAYMRGARSADYNRSAPLSFLPGLIEGPRLQALRQRMIVLLSGEGNLELPDQSRQLGTVLDSKTIPHSLRMLGPGRNHDWHSWRELLPPCVAEFT
jgi:esterase/lipase superfamily enzyme